MLTLPQEAKLVEAFGPAADAAGRTGDWISLKNYGRAFIVVHITQGNAATVTLTLLQATSVAGAGSKALTWTVPIWANESTATTDTLTRQTDGLAFTTSATLAGKIVVFQVDPRYLDVNNGFDCLTVTTGASNVANITQGMYVLSDPRFNGNVLPSAIVD